MVKIKIPVIVERKESKSLYIPPLVLIGVLLLSSIIGVFYFHGDYEPLENYKYDEDWFRSNNNAIIPPDLTDLFDNLSDVVKDPDLIDDYPPIENPEDLLSGLFSNKTDFYVIGMVPPLVWKITSLSEYVEGKGWVFGTPKLEEYYTNDALGTNMRFTIVKEGVEVDQENKLFIATLYTSNQEAAVGQPATIAVNATSTPSITYSLYKDLTSGGLILDISSDVNANLTFMYEVGGDELDKADVISRSATMLDTVNYVSSNENLSLLASLPDGYFNNHPIIAELSNNLYVGDFETVYAQVERISNYLAINYNITPEEAPEGVDPVSWFILNGGGPPVYFLYTAAVLLRSYGIPARIALGYLNGEYNVNEDRTYFVPNKHLFAWLEVFDANLYWVPYNILPGLLAFTGEEPLNLIDVSLTPIVNVIAPRYRYGIPSVYIDENFTITVTILGVSDTGVINELNVIDLNESFPMGTAPFQLIPGGIQATFTTNYAFIYAILAKDPLYGVHDILLTFGSYRYIVKIALLERVEISP